MITKDLMTAQPFFVTASATVREAAELMRTHDIGMIPVVRDAKSKVLVGVVTDRDIAVRGVAKGQKIDAAVRTVMTSEPLATTSPESPIEEVVQLMERARVRRLPIVDDADHLVGVVALADVVRGLGKREPNTVEEILERVSAASHALA